MRKKTSLLIVLICWFSYYTYAQKFEATINNTTVEQHQPFEIRFTLYDGKGKNFTAPSFDHFVVRGGPNRSSNMQWINGDMSQSVAFSYYLQADEVGTFVISQASIEVAGKTYQTKPIEIEVIEASQPQPQTQTTPKSQQIPGKQPSKQPSGSIEKQIEDNAFIQVAVSKSNVFQGEPLTVTFKLIHKLRGADFGISKNPSMNGFWVEDHSPDNISFKREVINGVQYQTALIKSATMYPQRPGKLEIDAMDIDLAVRVGRSFFDNRIVEHTIKSTPIAINVKPLPVEGRPVDFSGAVGKFTMTSSIDQSEVEIDEPITFNMKISGRGNMNMIEAPELNLSNDFEVYDPKVSQKRSSKTFEYLIIPRNSGQYRLDPFTFSYFDLETGTYKTLETESYIFDITGDVTTNSPGNNSIGGIRKEEVELLAEDIRFIKTNKPNWKNTNEQFLFTNSFWTWTAIPPLLLLSLLVFKRLKPETEDELVLKRKRAEKKAARHLATAKQLLNDPSNQFYKALNDSLYGYIGDKLTMDTAEMSKQHIAQQLGLRDVSQDYIEQFNQLVSNNEMALYAPLPENLTRDQLLEQASQLIKKMEQEL